MTLPRMALAATLARLTPEEHVLGPREGARGRAHLAPAAQDPAHDPGRGDRRVGGEGHGAVAGPRVLVDLVSLVRLADAAEGGVEGDSSEKGPADRGGEPEVMRDPRGGRELGHFENLLRGAGLQGMCPAPASSARRSGRRPGAGRRCAGTAPGGQTIGDPRALPPGMQRPWLAVVPLLSLACTEPTRGDAVAPAPQAARAPLAAAARPPVQARSFKFPPSRPRVARRRRGAGQPDRQRRDRAGARLAARGGGGRGAAGVHRAQPGVREPGGPGASRGSSA